ncbi:MAG: SH3 domain-containing protein [Desulfobacteraceae bacterium]
MRLLHGFLVLLVILAPGTMLTPNDGMASEKATDGEYGTTASQEGTPHEPSNTHSNLLSTLEVTTDYCYVYLQPKHSSQYFGPLAREEKLKWLDNQGGWFHAWIPRLWVSGWVHESKVKETTETLSSSVEVPKYLLRNVIVNAKRANIRQGPSTRTNIISGGKKGQEFWLLNRKGNWCQIWLSDLEKKGWIHSSLVREKQKKPKSP